MIIAHNITAINAHRQLGMNANNVTQSLEKLSSGLKINQAADDAAGLAISEKMRGQIRGLEQAGRNIQNSISLIQTAEGGLNEVHALLQRGRELSVQASNDALNSDDREAIQEEINQIKEEIDNISTSTEFNTIKLLNRSNVDVDMAELQKFQKYLPGMLKYGEEIVENAFGLKANGSPINIQFKNIDNKGGTLALVRHGGGNVTTMEIDVSDLGKYVEPHGNDDRYNYFDATIVHEMVHAVFAETINSLPKWFNEGAAEYASGGADRLYAEVQNIMFSGKTEEQALREVMDSVGDGNIWGGSSLNYAGAYGAVSYLDKLLQDPAHSSNITSFLSSMKKDGTNNNFETALNEALGMSINQFIADYKASGFTHVKALYDGFAGDPANGITGGDVGSAPHGYDPLNVPNYELTPGEDPLLGWDENFLGLDMDSINSGPLIFQIGANAGQSIELKLDTVESSALGIAQVDVVMNSSEAITSFDEAIHKVSTFRSNLGAVQNRLEHTYSVTMNSAENLTAAESRIRDTDMAKTMMEFTKNNILTQASQAMLAQAQQMPQGVLQLLQ